jgi:uncharacterized protein (TIGR00288 family)
MSDQRVMLLIDADNVSVDVIQQAVKLLLEQHGALHVRRAYCTAESALKHQAAFKRLGIKPMVNLAAGKNSTDIALAVDAIDLVLAERPDVVVIASSDSDFAPLVQRLREKGCTVRGIGQAGKTGSETQDVYDDYTVLEHQPAVAKKAARAATKATPARKAPARKAARAAAAPAPPPPPPPAPEPLSAQAEAVLGCLAELRNGQPLALNVAVQRLREAGLLGKNASSLKLFKALGPRFELAPAPKPTQVRLLG